MAELAVGDIEKIESVLRRASGISLTKSLRRTLQDAFHKAATAIGLAERQFIDRLMDGDLESISCLVEHSVIGETYFFRHPEQFAAIKTVVSTDFAEEQAIRIWSAGCSTGEEPFSLAMILNDAGRSHFSDQVLATDICERELRIAKEGVYGPWSMRRVNHLMLSQHFTPLGEGRVSVVDAARRKVEFRIHNLVADPAPLSDCHIVFCRNVLIYFTPDTCAEVLRKLAGALKPGGILVLGPVEYPFAGLLSLEWLELDGATVLRKPVQGQARSKQLLPITSKPKTAKKKYDSPILTAPEFPKIEPIALAPPEENSVPEQELGQYEEPIQISQPQTRFELAREAARQGRLDEAEQLALGSASEEMLPESYLLLSMAAEARGNLGQAVEQVRKALYLEPSLATGHALLVTLFQRLGRQKEADRARRNALEALDRVDDSAILRGVEAMTAGALKRALKPEDRNNGWPEDDL